MRRSSSWTLTACVAAALVAALFAVRTGPSVDDVHAGDGDVAVPEEPAVDPWAAPQGVTPYATRYVRFETLGVADGLPSERVTCVVAEGDDLYVGTDAGVALRRGGTWSVVGEQQGLAHRYVTSLARDPVTDTTWVSTLRGLSRISGGDVRTYTQQGSGLANDLVYHCVVDGRLVWCGTGAGLSVLDTESGTWSLHDTGNSIMHEPWCYAVAVGPQRGWVGLWGGGIVEIDRRTGRWREYRDPDGEMEIDLLADDGPIHEVSSFVAYADGLLWQTTYFGVSRYDGRRWRSFTQADSGMPGDFVTHVAAHGRAAWFATDQGLGVFDDAGCVAYRRNADGTCTVRVTRPGAEVETTTLATAPGDDYVLWTHPRERDVWIATGHGLSHGIAADR